MVKPRTLSWDSRAAFHMSSYSKPPSSASTSSGLSGSTCHKGSDISKTTSLSKGKATLSQMRTDLNDALGEINDNAMDQRYKMAFIKSECKKMEMEAYMRKMEIAHEEAENEKKCIEADKAHKREVEKTQLNIQQLREEGEVMCLKLQLAQLQSGQAVPSAGTSADKTGL